MIVDLDDVKIILKNYGRITSVLSLLMLLPIIIMFIYDSPQNTEEKLIHLLSFLSISLIYIGIGFFSRGIETKREMTANHTLVLVAFAWLITPLICSVPFYLTGILNPIDAVFESMGGLTTTGITMVKDVDALPKDILFYRSILEWIGGLGIIILGLTIFMRESAIAMKFYTSELHDRIRPSMRSTVLTVWKIYIVYTFSCMVLLYLAGMSPFDAINHSFTAISTGGFSTHTDNIQYFVNTMPLWQSTAIQVILMIFMILGATGFLIHLKLFEGDILHLLKNTEIRYIFMLILIAGILVSFELYLAGKDVFTAIIVALFQIVSAITSTGFTTDLTGWMPVSQLFVISLVLIGGAYNSTAGGMKIIRFVFFIKLIGYRIRKMILPKTAITHIKVGKNVIEEEEVISAITVSFLFVLVTIIGMAIVLLSGHIYPEYKFEPIEVLSICASAVGSNGVFFMSAYQSMPEIDKIVLILIMWIGRIEVIPVLVLVKFLFNLKIDLNKV